mmetsp:Transcript_17093/g.43981  ORF Transcript_17093/g.43981 Transcript_17093/m.43981 type:complete len:308 (-) Transcript_17093:86-1009(-)
MPARRKQGGRRCASSRGCRSERSRCASRRGCRRARSRGGRRARRGRGCRRHEQSLGWAVRAHRRGGARHDEHLAVVRLQEDPQDHVVIPTLRQPEALQLVLGHAAVRHGNDVLSPPFVLLEAAPPGRVHAGGRHRLLLRRLRLLLQCRQLARPRGRGAGASARRGLLLILLLRAQNEAVLVNQELPLGRHDFRPPILRLLQLVLLVVLLRGVLVVRVRAIRRGRRARHRGVGLLLGLLPQVHGGRRQEVELSQGRELVRRSLQHRQLGRRELGPRHGALVRALALGPRHGYVRLALCVGGAGSKAGL